MLQVVNTKLVDNLGQAVRTQLVDGLLADLLQDVRFLRVQMGAYEQTPNTHFTLSQEYRGFISGFHFSHSPQVVRRKPLNKLVYTLLSNTDLKRKMKEHGLSIKGDRQVRIVVMLLS